MEKKLPEWKNVFQKKRQRLWRLEHDTLATCTLKSRCCAYNCQSLNLLQPSQALPWIQDRSVHGSWLLSLDSHRLKATFKLNMSSTDSKVGCRSLSYTTTQSLSTCSVFPNRGGQGSDFSALKLYRRKFDLAQPQQCSKATAWLEESPTPARHPNPASLLLRKTSACRKHFCLFPFH